MKRFLVLSLFLLSSMLLADEKSQAKHTVDAQILGQILVSSKEQTIQLRVLNPNKSGLLEGSHVNLNIKVIDMESGLVRIQGKDQSFNMETIHLGRPYDSQGTALRAETQAQRGYDDLFKIDIPAYLKDHPMAESFVYIPEGTSIELELR